MLVRSGAEPIIAGLFLALAIVLAVHTATMSVHPAPTALHRSAAGAHEGGEDPAPLGMVIVSCFAILAITAVVRRTGWVRSVIRVVDTPHAGSLQPAEPGERKPPPRTGTVLRP